MNDQMSNGSYALDYASRGWLVFPCNYIEGCGCSCGRDCRSPGKHPATRNGFKDATTDPHLIKRIWDERPRLNVAIATGSVSDLVVVDLDGPEGIEAFAQLQKEHGPLPKTPVALTGGGGRHHFFKYPAGVVVKSGTRLLGLPIDVRADDGYVIAPRSNHYSGGIYEWEVFPADVPLADLPDWLLEIVANRSHHSAKQISELDEGLLDLETAPGVAEGQRNNRLLELVGADIGRGESAIDVLEKAMTWNQKCEPPMPEEKVARIVRYVELKDRSKTSRTSVSALDSRPAQRDAAWPILDETALYGIPGEFVKRIEPHSEADRAAILTQFMVFAGNAIGRGPYQRVEATRHHANLFAVIVGESAKARKGTSEAHVRSLLWDVDSRWGADCIASGMSSGEGVIHHVRDARPGTDDGVEDKRLLVVETEFASTLKVMRREGNILSALIRQAWDSGHLRTLTRNKPLRATDAHISIVGHITLEELTRSLVDVDVFNGFANRFLWCCARRSKLLPEGGDRPDMSGLVSRLRSTFEFAEGVTQMTRDQAAKELWADIYEQLADSPSGMFGVAVSRGEAQLLRLSGIYALLDQRAVIGVEHLTAAKALWDYAEASARYIFGGSTGHSLSDQVLRILSAGPRSRTEIHNSLGNHTKSTELTSVLSSLEHEGKICRKTVKTTGRPAEVWQLV